ncbi:class II glutamine amidotransferase [Nocardia xishanensis]
MCILTFVKPGHAPDLDALANGALANPHGHGYAVITGDTITVGHGMDPASVITEFAAVRAQHPDSAALFHSRLATHGPRRLDNCHPFRVGGDARTVLAHNGILPTTVHPGPGDPRSDTRIAAEDYLSTQPFGSLDSWAGRERLERWLGTDKMVILTVDTAYKHPAYIFNEHRGHWDNGSWYSNHGYRPHQWWADAADEYCANCGEPDYDRYGPHCPWCGFCTECSRMFPKCVCPGLDGEERYADLLDLEYT